ncbi:hypothetical protein SBA6_470035 [Candidatus Sulfopaludibacter sp. SbA6]|nr:hypothetical protein SBA6_470035 [Candidatus Sulfopaludibacter sp. SbA6]
MSYLAYRAPLTDTAIACPAMVTVP